MATSKLFFYRLVGTHIFSFVVGRAFVTDIEKLKLSSKTRSLEVRRVLNFFAEVTKVHIWSSLCMICCLDDILNIVIKPTQMYLGWCSSWCKFIACCGSPCIWGMSLALSVSGLLSSIECIPFLLHFYCFLPPSWSSQIIFSSPLICIGVWINLFRKRN